MVWEHFSAYQSYAGVGVVVMAYAGVGVVVTAVLLEKVMAALKRRAAFQLFGCHVMYHARKACRELLADESVSILGHLEHRDSFMKLYLRLKFLPFMQHATVIEEV